MIIINARFLTQKVTGVQRFAIEISRIIHNLDKELVFVSPADILDHALADELGVITIGKRSGTLWEQIDLRMYLAVNKNPLLINFCNTGILYYQNQIVTVHDMSYKVNPKWFSKKFYLWYNFLIPNLTKYSQKVLTVSNSSKNDLIKYLNIDPCKISVIYNSSNLNTNNNFEAVKYQKYILSVSSLDPRKNLSNLIKAFNLIEEKLKLVIVGLRNDNFALNDELLNDNIEIKGYVTDEEMSRLMQNAEAFVYLSFYEGFGLPPLEAMCFECPVIVSDIPAHNEVCAKAALYVDPYDVNDIKNKIIEVVTGNEIKKKLISVGKENIKRFSWFKSAEKVLNNINDIVKKYN